MKWVSIFLTIWLLQACDSFDVRPSNIQTFNHVPDSWHASGRLGAVFNGENQNAGFEVDFAGQNYKLTLTGSLGLGQIVIESNAHNLRIDSKPTTLNFKQWMTGQTHWYFPIHDLGKIAFNQAFVNTDWQVKILSRHPNYLPRSIRLMHNTENIKIKLIFKNITFVEP